MIHYICQMCNVQLNKHISIGWLKRFSSAIFSVCLYVFSIEMKKHWKDFIWDSRVKKSEAEDLWSADFSGPMGVALPNERDRMHV